MILNLRLMKKLSKYKNNKSLFLIPYFFTFLNAIFGFLSILKALEDEYAAAAYYILLAVIADCLDGRLARAFNSVSYLGGELDSLCDAISFCLAPSVLIYCWSPDNFTLMGKSILIFYLCAGLFRLARFNSTPQKQQNYFIGLPTPMAAFFLASLVLSERWIKANYLRFIFFKATLFPIVAILSLLMISHIKFFSLKRYKFNFIPDYFNFIFLVFYSLLAIIHGYPILLIIGLFYLLISVYINFKNII